MTDYKTGFQAGFEATIRLVVERVREGWAPSDSLYRGDILRMLGELGTEMAKGGAAAVPKPPALIDTGSTLSTTVGPFADLVRRVRYLEEQERLTQAVFEEHASKLTEHAMRLDRPCTPDVVLLRVEALERIVGSPDAPNRSLISVVARVEQLEKNGSGDAESINEHARKLGLIGDVLTGKL